MRDKDTISVRWATDREKDLKRNWEKERKRGREEDRNRDKEQERKECLSMILFKRFSDLNKEGFRKRVREREREREINLLKNAALLLRTTDFQIVGTVGRSIK